MICLWQNHVVCVVRIPLHDIVKVYLLPLLDEINNRRNIKTLKSIQQSDTFKKQKVNVGIVVNYCDILKRYNRYEMPDELGPQVVLRDLAVSSEWSRGAIRRHFTEEL